jgi:hypothetical protein
MPREFRDLNNEDKENIKEMLAALTDGYLDKYVSATRIRDGIIRSTYGAHIPVDFIRDYLESLPEGKISIAGTEDRPTYRFLEEWV